MENRWAESHSDPLDACVYGSWLLGGEPDLVLHGGGNTSVKVSIEDITGRTVDVLYVK
jgi:rhamnose utilization protein RhaD (predicted bifunctional aldolase and dehydrogenase)